MAEPMSRVGTTYNIPPAPPDPASTDWLDLGALRIGVEYRKVDPEALAEIYGDTEHMAELEEASPAGGFTDEGVSLHIVDPDDGFEYVRFDMFVDEPHYHYVDKVADTNTIVHFDTVAHGPMIPWTLAQIRSRLPEMLRHAGATAFAETITADAGSTAAARVEEKLREIGEYA